jgi:hypothetical protein
MKVVAIGVVGAVVLIVSALVVVDVVATPTPSTGTCIFQNRIVLPDICVSGCPKCPTCPTASTRPYFVFWTEAASCPGFCLCP